MTPLSINRKMDHIFFTDISTNTSHMIKNSGDMTLVHLVVSPVNVMRIGGWIMMAEVFDDLELL